MSFYHVLLSRRFVMSFYDFQLTGFAVFQLTGFGGGRKPARRSKAPMKKPSNDQTQQR
jgi:hypothetical protein